MEDRGPDKVHILLQTPTHLVVDHRRGAERRRAAAAVDPSPVCMKQT